MMARALRLVVFDVDGTLVDSEALILEGFGEAFAGAGLTAPPRTEILAQVGLSLPVAVARMIPAAGSAVQARIVQGYRAAFLRMRAEQGPASVPLFEGARETIEALAARPDVLIGAATGMARRGLEHVLDVHGLGRYFITRQTADTNPSKPNPGMLESALSEAGVERADAVMVGDTTHDIEMAVNAGVAGIGVSWGHHAAADLARAGAASVIGSFAQLPMALDEIWERA